MNANYASDSGWGAKTARIADAMEQAYMSIAPASESSIVSVSTDKTMPSASDLIARARSAIGRNTKYQLGAGGSRPTADLPAVPTRGCDCSGYVCWCLGISRQTNHNLYVHFNGGWINTDAIVHDARSSTGFFYEIESPKVGAIIVYPSKKPNRKYGHIGIVTEVEEGEVSKVIHCSNGNYAKLGDAIAETDPKIFEGALLAWYEGLV